MDSIKKGKPITKQAREVIYKVYLYFVNEGNAFKHIENGYFNKVTERVAKATGVSKRTVIELLNDKYQKGSSEFEPPKRKKKKISFRVRNNLKSNEIRNMIYDIQLKTKEDFSLAILHQSLVEVFGYQGNTDHLKKILKQMGFKRMAVKSNDKVKLLVEKPNLRLRRLCYIREIQEIRNAGANIVYIGETYVRYTPTPNEEDKKNDKLSTSKERMIIIHAGNGNGFLPGALMLSTSSDSDYYYEKELFKYWIYNQLIPTLPPDSLLVIEDIPRHNAIIMKTKPPHAYAKKHEFIAWLIENTPHPIDPNLTKPELYDKICEYNKENTILNVLQDYGHKVLRLPKYQINFNPIEKLWADLNGYVTNNIKGLSTIKIESLIKEKIESMGTEQWSKACQDVIQLEDEYLRFEEEFDKYTDNLVLTNVDDSCDSDLEMSESETSAKENSDSQSESEFSLADVKEHLSSHNNEVE